jgi:hypothetical protein
MKRAVALMLLVVLGCSGAQGSRNDLPPAARPLWDRCRSAINTMCHDRAVGDPTQERECEARTGHDFGALPDDAAREQYMRAHGCAL